MPIYHQLRVLVSQYSLPVQDKKTKYFTKNIFYNFFFCISVQHSLFSVLWDCLFLPKILGKDLLQLVQLVVEEVEEAVEVLIPGSAIVVFIMII